MPEDKTHSDEVFSLVHDIKAELDEKGMETGEQMAKLESMVEDMQGRMDDIAAENAKRKAELEARESENETGFSPVIKSGKYEGQKSTHVWIAGEILRGAAQAKGRAADSMMSDEFTKALDSTTDGSGDDWVPTGISSTLYSEWEKVSKVYSLFPNVTMPTNPYHLPIVTADPTVYRAPTESTATTESSPTTSQIILTAGKLMAETDFSYEIEEDSALAIAPLVQDRLSRAMSAAMDSVIINGDSTTGSANINYFGTGAVSASINTGSACLLFDGLRHYGLVDNTGMGADISGLAIGDFGTLMGKVGKYATRPGDNAWVMDVWSYLKAVQLSQFITVDVYGANATLLNGELGKVYGIPVIVSEEVAKAASTGKVNQTAANNTLGTIILVHRPSWVVGSKRSVLVETDRDIQKQQLQMVISTRMALKNFGGTTNTAVGYDVVV